MIDRETVAVASIADGRTWRKTAKKAIKNKVARRSSPARRRALSCSARHVFYLICGVLDVIRNKNLDLELVKKYFLGHGSLTWYLSPFNLFIDLLTLPYWNKGVYELKDLPPPYQAEIKALLETIDQKNLAAELQDKLKDHDREMIFFKWYGRNLDTILNFPEFHRDYKYIRTIGVSIFNRRKSTNKHFGPAAHFATALQHQPDSRATRSISKSETRGTTGATTGSSFSTTR